jgi:hypothetical protein
VTSAFRRQAGFGLLESLDREWCELVRCHRTAVVRWGQHELLAPCRSLDDVLSLAKLNPDAILGALLTEVSAGDQLAGRVVLQAMLGRMARMAQRDPRSSLDDYLARLCCVINSYPLGRRPVRIAANLSLDTLKAVSQDRRWLQRGDVLLLPSLEPLEQLLKPTALDGSPCDSVTPVDVEVRQVLDASGSLQLIEDFDVTLLRCVYADGMTGSQAARRLRISPSSVRVRCSKAVRRLSAHAVELTDAA